MLITRVSLTITGNTEISLKLVKALLYLLFRDSLGNTSKDLEENKLHVRK